MKKLNSIFSLLICTGLICTCSNKESEDIITDPPGTDYPPVETNAANTSYRPAFAGQTRIGGVRTTTSIQSRILTSSLQSPWGITSLPDGRFLVTERQGRIRIVTAAGSVGNALTGVPAVNSSGQGGLLGITIDPQFATNRMVYWSFSEDDGSGTLTAIAKGRLSDNEAALENVTVIFRAGPSFNSALHYGGRVVFDNTGNLMVSTGERSSTTTRPQAQQVNSGLGKIFRITTSGQPAPGNPVFSQAGALPGLYSLGHRNPQGLAIHPTTGDLWQSEHGPRGGDEINRVRGGANYGWPTITYGIEYSGQAIGAPAQQQSGLEQPAYYYDPVISPSGITFYKGNRVAEWENNLFIASLSGMHIARLVVANNTIIGEERLLATEGQRFRDITQGSDNALYAITDGGRLYRIDRQ